MATAFSQAQDPVPLGNYTLQELQMKECSFDKDATAVVLLEEAKSDYNDRRNLITTYHVRIKILKEKGIEYANVSIPFYRKDDVEYIDEVQAIIINPKQDGDVEKYILERKLIYTEKTSNNWGEVKFTFPGVKVGSIVEYTYRSNVKHYGYLEDWIFQWRIPVVKSKYKLVVVPDAEFAYQVQKNPNYVVDVKTNSQDGSVMFEMNNIPGLTDEPYMDARKDYIQKVKFQLSGYSGNGYKQKYSTTWPELARDLLRHEQFGGQLGRDLAGTDDFIKETKTTPSALAKMRMVYAYVKDRMSWNGVNFRYTTDGVKTAWNKKTGNSAEVNLILVNLLRAVDLDADPILVSERYNGRVNTSYPFEDQFNTVYAAVAIDNHYYYLDATNRYLPTEITPSEVLNTTGFIVNRKNSKLVEILDEKFKYNESILVTGKLNGDGNLVGSAAVRSTEFARAVKVGRYKSDSKRFIEQYFTNGNNGIVIDSFETTGDEVDTLAFIQKFDFSLPTNTAGEYRFVDLNLFTGQKTNPFILNERFANINFGYRQRIVATSILEVPESFVVDVLPKAKSLTTPDRSISYQKTVSFLEGKLVQNTLMEVNKSYFDADEYQTLKAFYKLMFESITEQVVLKKK
jgi:hypothetical protein